LALTALGVTEATPATWRLTPTLEGSTEYTDNVRGVPSGEESDLILTARPGLGLRATGARLQLNFNGSLAYEEFLYTKKTGGWSGNMLGVAEAELYEDIFFVDASTSLRRRAIATPGATAFTDRDLGSNQSDVFNVRLSPVVRLRVGRWVESETRASAAHTVYDALGQNEDPAAGTVASDSTVYSLSQTFTSGRKFQRIGWSLSASERRTKRDKGGASTLAGDTFKRRNAQARVSYAYDRWFTPDVTVGYDDNDDNSLTGSDDFSGSYWLLGFTSQPGPRTTLTLRAGHRFGGPSYQGNFRYRVSSALQVQASYNESVKTQQEQLADEFDFVGTDEFGNLIDTRTGLPLDPDNAGFDLTFGDAVFRTRTFRLGFSGTRLLNSYSLSATISRRDTSGASPREATMSTLTASYRRQLSPRLSVAFTGSVADTEDDATADTRTYRLSSSVNYALSDSLNSSLVLRRLDRTTSGTGGSDIDLTENSMVLTLRKSF
jgi:uncharacterized protein (PEP-CTERM system associated)